MKNTTKLPDEKITAWVTRYALTTGIEMVSGTIYHHVNSTMLIWGNYKDAHGKDWHRTPEEALARAEEMREARIKSHEKSIAKLEALVFTMSAHLPQN